MNLSSGAKFFAVMVIGWCELKAEFDNQFLILLGNSKNDFSTAAFDNPFQDMEYPVFHTAFNPSQVTPGFSVLHKGRGLNMSLTSHRRIPRYLSAITLFSDWNLVSKSHFEYWRCTGAYASMILQRKLTSSDTRHEFEFGPPGPELIHINRVLTHELCLLIQLSLLGEEASEVNPQFNLYGLGEIHPVLEQLIINWASITATYGFSVMEGLLQDRLCVAVEENTYLYSNLKKWTLSANPDTKRTILEIDRLGCVDIDSDPDEVVTSMDELISSDEINEENDLFPCNRVLWEFKEQRNDVSHRNKMLRGVAVMVMNLCCLMFWDSISEGTFEHARKFIKHHFSSKSEKGRVIHKGEFSPETFYSEWSE